MNWTKVDCFGMPLGLTSGMDGRKRKARKGTRGTEEGE